MGYSTSFFTARLDADHMISMAQSKAAVTPVRQQWTYCSLALSHQYTRHTRLFMAVVDWYSNFDVNYEYILLKIDWMIITIYITKNTTSAVLKWQFVFSISHIPSGMGIMILNSSSRAIEYNIFSCWGKKRKTHRSLQRSSYNILYMYIDTKTCAYPFRPVVIYLFRVNKDNFSKF